MQVNVGRGITLDVDVDKFNPDVMSHVVYIGLRNILMDAHASATRKGGSTDDEARALSEKKLAAMYNGEVRVTSTREGDPVAREMVRMATDIVKNAIRAKGGKLGDYDVAGLAKAYVTKHPELRAKAEASVADAKSVTVDIAELGL